ncbi:hypothetical protein RBG11_004216 [Vibrio parahaemolyticus]|nr:hypothetical protein [Vibrio parahaemolyticus]
MRILVNKLLNKSPETVSRTDLIGMPMQWKCDICDRVRPDAKISVETHHYQYNAVKMAHNVKYCNDNPKCQEAAKDDSKFKEKLDALFIGKLT